MRHQQLKDWLVLSYYGELMEKQEKALHEHLRDCVACRQEKEALDEFYDLLELDVPEVDSVLLEQARAQLRGALSVEGSSPNTGRSQFFSGFGLDWLYGGRALAVSVASAFLGLALGMLIFSEIERKPADSELLLGSDVEISGVEFLNPNPSDGDLDFIYRAVQPVRLRGGLNDPRIERVLTEALKSVDNPGVRLQVVDALVQRSRATELDQEVKNSLLEVLKMDPNVGVRKRALGVLSELPLDETLKRALIQTLVNDPNPGMRVAAINILAVKAGQGLSLNPELLNQLASVMDTEKNDFIRRRSREFLQEVQYR